MSTTIASNPEFNSALYTPPESIRVNGLAVAYRRKGAGEPVLFLHGAGMTRRWLPFYEALSRHVDLIVPEHPGFGDTELPGEFDNFSDLVIHYSDFADALGLDRFHLVGHSFGGWMAAEFACFYHKRLASLTLMSPLGLRTPGTPAPDLFRASGKPPGWTLFNGDASEFREYLIDGDEHETMFRRYGELTALARFAWNPRYDVKLEHRLQRVATPTCVIEAQEDLVVPVAIGRRYAELIPGSTVKRLESRSDRSLGHGFIAQDPELSASVIASFVQTHLMGCQS